MFFSVTVPSASASSPGWAEGARWAWTGAPGQSAEDALAKGWKGWPGGRGLCSPWVCSKDCAGGSGRGGARCRWKMLFSQKKLFLGWHCSGTFPGHWRAAGCLWAISGLQASLVRYWHLKSGRCQYPGFRLLSRNWKISEHWSGSLTSLSLSFPICKMDLCPLCWSSKPHPGSLPSSILPLFIDTCFPVHLHCDRPYTWSWWCGRYKAGKDPYPRGVSIKAQGNRHWNS